MPTITKTLHWESGGIRALAGIDLYVEIRNAGGTLLNAALEAIVEDGNGHRSASIAIDSAATGDCTIDAYYDANGQHAASGWINADESTLRVAENPYSNSATVQSAAAAALAAYDPPTKAEMDAAIASAFDVSALAQAINGTIVVNGPVFPNGQIRITRGMDYDNDDNGRSINITDSTNSWPDLTGATPYLVIKSLNGQFTKPLHFSGTVVVPNTNPRKVRFELTAAQTSIIQQSNYQWGVYAILANSRKVDLVAFGKNLIVGEMPLAD